MCDDMLQRYVEEAFELGQKATQHRAQRTAMEHGFVERVLRRPTTSEFAPGRGFHGRRIVR